MKFTKILALLFAAVLCTVAFTSCGDDDDNNQNCYFTTSVEGFTYKSTSGNADADQKAALAYMDEVEQAYCKALGITSGNSVFVSGDYSTVSSQMKTKFEGATLPAALSRENFSYSFKVVLYGADLKKGTATSAIVEKTFSDSGK